MSKHTKKTKPDWFSSSKKIFLESVSPDRPKENFRWWVPTAATVLLAILSSAIVYGALQQKVAAQGAAIIKLQDREYEQTKQLSAMQSTLKNMQKSLNRIESKIYE